MTFFPDSKIMDWIFFVPSFPMLIEFGASADGFEIMLSAFGDFRFVAVIIKKIREEHSSHMVLRICLYDLSAKGDRFPILLINNGKPIGFGK